MQLRGLAVFLTSPVVHAVAESLSESGFQGQSDRPLNPLRFKVFIDASNHRIKYHSL
jgi:hypothetical protein